MKTKNNDFKPGMSLTMKPERSLRDSNGRRKVTTVVLGNRGEKGFFIQDAPRPGVEWFYTFADLKTLFLKPNIERHEA